MKLVVIHLKLDNITKESVELVTGIRFEKSIEQTWFGKNELGYVYLSKFGTICFVGFESHQIVSYLKALRIEYAKNYEDHYLHQDYQIAIDPSLNKEFSALNDKVIIRSKEESLLLIIAIVVSQSVGMERFEQLLDKNMPQSKALLDNENNFSIFKRKKLLKFASFLASTRQEMIVDLLLLDKPNTTWDDEVAESLYNKLSNIFELKDRFTLVEYKLSLIRDNISFMMDAINHQNSEFLEWIIIWLIAFEIGMSLYKVF